jgi:PAS domain S-box-containing protein
MLFLFWIALVLLICGAAWIALRCVRLTMRLQQMQKQLRSCTRRVKTLLEKQDAATDHQKATEEKLRTYLQLMDSVINTMPNPVYFKDENGVYQGCNIVFAKQILGLTRDRIIGRRPQDLPNRIPPQLAAGYQREEMKAVEKKGLHIFEAQMQQADDRTRDFLFSCAPLTDSRGRFSGSVTVLSDLTEKNRAARDRLHKERLQGVLETAGAVCHELNQPLQSLSGYIEIMMCQTEDPELSPLLKTIMSQIERMRDITNKLQGVTRYEATEYAENTKIIDIHKASAKMDSNEE